MLLTVIAGYDPKDPISVNAALRDYTGKLGESVRGLRIGFPRVSGEGNEPEVIQLVGNAAAVLAELGVKISHIDLPSLIDTRWLNVACVLEIAAMADAMAIVPNPSDPFTAYMVERDIAGRKRLLDQAMRIGQLAEQRYDEIFHDIDLIAMPTVAITAPRVADTASSWQLPDEPFVEMIARYTRIFNLIRFPAISIPCGFAANGMPVGLQLAGRPFEEETVLRAAYAYEQATRWHMQLPPLLSSPNLHFPASATAPNEPSESNHH